MTSDILDGLLLVDKPKGVTSHDVVSIVRKKLQMTQVGHAGTLDPDATGLLVVLLGEGTKLSSVFLEKEKSYYLKAQLGLTTDTLDSSGKVLSEASQNELAQITTDQILKAVNDLKGEFEWSVPIFSATKVKGEALYEAGRRGENPVTPVKKMSFEELKNIKIENPYVALELSCSKGSFIRSWASKLGENLGCGACLIELRRTFSKPFSVTQAISLENLSRTSLGESFISLEAALASFDRVLVQSLESKLVQNGQIPHDMKVRLMARMQRPERKLFQVIDSNDNRLLALVAFEPEEGFVIKRVFPRRT